MRNKIILLFILTFLLGLGITTPAYSADVPAGMQVKLMLKILSMDRNFDRFGDPIKIGVSSDVFLSELNAVKGKLKIKKKDFVAEKMGSPDDIANYKVIYVGKDWAANYSAASSKAVENKALMFCETEDGVLSGGGAISFKVVAKKPKIVINIGNVKNQGTDFPSGFLKITVVVGSMN
ncbi:MAG: YfiR family protein [bacterium]|nr:YfiR family protein [bacterium]